MTDIKTLIRARLEEIEVCEGVRTRSVYACESGSRAWGFPSADSDYDVRFLYLAPLEWYLSIADRRDVIERPVEGPLDINGWELRKALRLFRKSNPPLLEWLDSPIVYHEHSTVAARMRELTPMYYSPVACLHHYLHMARGNYRDYLKGQRIWVKKYFYVLRPLLAIRWIERGLGIAPMEFEVLVSSVVDSAELRAEIEHLVAEKQHGVELDDGPRIASISDFIEQELARLERAGLARGSPPPPVEPLDELFRAALFEAWGGGS